MDFKEINKIINVILVILIIYFAFTFVQQQGKFISYDKDMASYNKQIEDLQKEKEHLVAKQENVNSPEYIEKEARANLDMYMPNERVYIDLSK